MVTFKQIAEKGITPEQIENQLNEFKTGFPFLKLEAAAGIGKGIIAPDADERQKLEKAWNEYKAEGKRVVKFVPASGAASRMFKNMRELCLLRGSGRCVPEERGQGN